jgi:hypothetical protein
MTPPVATIRMTTRSSPNRRRSRAGSMLLVVVLEWPKRAAWRRASRSCAVSGSVADVAVGVSPGAEDGAGRIGGTSLGCPPEVTYLISPT